ncbi:hypothetical protein RhiirA5_406978 [Rhizophagus irregularis]|uniref:Uncharacterized protein n=1 Tax=Rhizophagus irregularis TaxID=588596 RepID=A0A2N0QBJ9_9GLOM|nr:hypothetical protein RhiirA5_406978 [Rhizophagus irregularis]
MIDKHRPSKLEVDGLFYPIALKFKLIGRCHSKENAINNWMCKEWCMQFIDAGRLPVNNEPLWTTNNYMERINQTIEATYSGKQSVLTFVERLYGVTLMRENIMEQNTGRVIYEAGLITVQLSMHNL